MKVLVTGGSGFVGAAVIRRLLDEGLQVRALVRPSSDLRNLHDLPVEIVEGNLSEPASLPPAVAGCEGLFHVAADYRLWVPKPAAMYKANVDGTCALMEAAQAAGVKRIVYTSSVATLGHHKNGAPADEATPVKESDMIGPYKHSKFKAEEAVQQLIRDQGLPAVIVNPSTPIGPRDVKPTPTGRIIVDFVAGRIPAYLDTGLNIAHVDDVANGHLLAFQKGRIGRRYILGGENLPFSQILAQIAEVSGKRAPRLKLPRRALVPVAFGMELVGRLSRWQPLLTRDSLKMAAKRMYFSCARAETELGYSHRPAKDAIFDAYRWFKSQGYC